MHSRHSTVWFELITKSILTQGHDYLTCLASEF